MKHRVLVVIFLIFAFTACKEEENEPLPIPTVQEEMVANESQIVCYQGIVKKDTFNLSFQIDSSQKVSGELAYLFFEKDKNNGTIAGQMFGDTLKANYTFMSEGLKNVREVVFLRKEKILIEAYGDVSETEGETKFKDPKKMHFDSATVLSEIECPEAK
ncbi:hypothetical protein [Flavobacterium tegetincola]|uniref:hypothetical protein n=1 Tax=Flavobacterium tegetincola TaxID=150172 RepID=UPI00040A0219|nr:hypothetical protein [Flavobacterium tegetincola]